MGSKSVMSIRDSPNENMTANNLRSETQRSQTLFETGAVSTTPKDNEMPSFKNLVSTYTYFIN